MQTLYKGGRLSLVTRLIYLIIGITIVVGLIVSHKYSMSSAVSSSSQSSGSTSGGNVIAQLQPQISQNPFPNQQNGTGQLPQEGQTDQSVSSHTLSSGGREDVLQIGSIISSQGYAYTGDDITFTATLKNQAPYKKFVKILCFESSDGNFGCSPGFNLDPGQVFSISNNGRFTSSGVKYIWVTWSQDGVNFYSPVDSQAGHISIF